MAKKEDLLKDLDWVTEKISSQVWILNLGTLGTTWSLLITTTIPDKLKITFVEARWIFVSCIAALLCEMGQYLASYIMYFGILKKLEADEHTTFSYDKNSGMRKLRFTFFYAKIALTVAASLYLLLIVFPKLA